MSNKDGGRPQKSHGFSCGRLRLRSGCRTTKWMERVLGREIGGKKNILVMNDEAHHAYRIRQEETEEEHYEDPDDLQAEDEFVREATVWV